jgi:glycosyltransferase involved in cell wall biosynthesis
LKGCVDSVLSQRDVDVRVLIIDDASSDNTPYVAEGLAAADQRVSHFRNKVNLGLIGTANKGVIDWATADYVVLLSADDAITQGSLARATRLMNARPEVVLTYGRNLMIHYDDHELATVDSDDPCLAVVPGKDFLRQACEFGNPVPAAGVVMRTSVQRQIGGYNARFKHTSDLDMWLRAAAVGYVGVVNAVQGLYRWHGSNMSAAYHSGPIGDREEVLATCEDFLEHYRGEFPEFGEWLRLMRRRFGDEAILLASKSFETGNNKAWRDALQFGRKYRSDYWNSPIWWKFFLKRLVGRRSTHLIQRVEKAVRFEPHVSCKRTAWYDHGMQVGWWPEKFQISLWE